MEKDGRLINIASRELEVSVCLSTHFQRNQWNEWKEEWNDLIKYNKR